MVYLNYYSKKNKWKIQIIIILIYLYVFKKNNFKTNIKLDELKFFLNRFSIFYKNNSYNINNLIIKERKDILNFFSISFRKNITYIDTIFLNTPCNFGNCLILLNKLIFYCEILGCKYIILNKKWYWFIRNNIYIKKNNISISITNYENNKNKFPLVYSSFIISYVFFNIIPEIKINYLRDEIIHNIPKINANNQDLYIHIRSDNIFKKNPHSNYAQPPLCFYKNILNNFKFRNVYLISKNEKNPVINKLIFIYLFYKFF